MLPSEFTYEYNYILESFSSIYNKTQWINSQKNNLALQVIVYLPYISNCDNPRRTALLNTNNFFLASNSSLFLHTTNDDLHILNRLQSFLYYPNGNKNIILKGLYIIALIMLQDYYHDIEEDIINNKYNPLETNRWDFEELENKLIHEITLIKCKQLDVFFPINEIRTQTYWWNNSE